MHRDNHGSHVRSQRICFVNSSYIYKVPKSCMTLAHRKRQNINRNLFTISALLPLSPSFLPSFISARTRRWIRYLPLPNSTVYTTPIKTLCFCVSSSFVINLLSLRCYHSCFLQQRRVCEEQLGVVVPQTDRQSCGVLLARLMTVCFFYSHWYYSSRHVQPEGRRGHVLIRSQTPDKVLSQTCPRDTKCFVLFI